MKHCFFIFLFSFQSLLAQTFPVETIKVSGDNDKRINLVILSDGYQTGELDDFILDATNFSNTMFSQSPFLEYADYFNVYAIKVPSNESGADHPANATDFDEMGATPNYVDTYFNATFDSFGFHRLLYYEIDGNSTNNTQTKINSVLASNFPNYDQALIIVNSDEYGGSGGDFPMAYSGFWGPDITIHEIGHSLFNLIDEYYPIDDVLAIEGINMTQETNPSLVKWKNWIGINSIGIYQHFDDEGMAKPWYRPHQNCKMRRIDWPFCSVCKEGIIEKIHSLVSPINSYTPDNNTVDNPIFPLDFQLNLIKPSPNTLESVWTLNASSLTNNVDEISLLETDLIEGVNTLTTVINDNTILLKVDNHDSFHVYTVTWTINYTGLSVEDIKSKINTYDISLYPNPTKSILNLKFESNNDQNLKVDIVSLGGKKVKTLFISNYENQEIDISSLSQGIYMMNFYSSNTLIASKKLVKN